MKGENMKFLDIWLTINGTATNNIKYFIDAAVWYLDTLNSSIISDSEFGSNSFLNFSKVFVIERGTGPVFSKADWLILFKRQFFIVLCLCLL